MKKKSGQNDDFNPFKSAPKAERANITARANNTAPMVLYIHQYNQQKALCLLYSIYGYVINNINYLLLFFSFRRESPPENPGMATPPGPTPFCLQISPDMAMPASSGSPDNSMSDSQPIRYRQTFTL